MTPDQFLSMTKSMVNGTTVGNAWQDYLSQWYQGTGQYWVPPPQYGATRAQLLANMNKCQLFIDEFENYFTYIFKAELTTPMHNLQNLLKQRRYEYELAIAELDKQALPDATKPPTDIEVPIETPVEETGTSNTTLLLVGAGVVGLYLATRKRSTRAKKITGVNNLLPVAAVGIALYFALKPKGQEAPAPTE